MRRVFLGSGCGEVWVFLKGMGTGTTEDTEIARKDTAGIILIYNCYTIMKYS